MVQNKVSQRKDAELADFLATFYDDPYGFVMAAYPWGEPTLADGSANPLADKHGPEPWQKRLLLELGEHIRHNKMYVDLGMQMKVWRSAVGSGHGVGKSALVAWIIHFLMSTRVDTRGVVTASTQFQLEDKTWPELGKWTKLLINSHWFIWTATTFSFAYDDETQRKNYRTTAATVSETNTEAFAGLHNEGKTVFVIFDEASGVYPKIWEVAEGALFDGEAFFFAFGNMTQPDGEFVDCFDKHGDLYYTLNVDSREVSFTNKNAIEDLIKKHGIDDDIVRVRVLGMPPAQAFNTFISKDGVMQASQRDAAHDFGAALIMAIDVARYGRDKTVFGWRQGRDARSIPMLEFQGLSTTKVAELAAIEINAKRPDAVVIESTGSAAGVIDILRDKGYVIHEVHPGSAAIRFEAYTNKRAEMWAGMRDWLYEVGVIAEDDTDLHEQLVSVNYTYDRHGQKIQLESKEDMFKTRGLPSPDRADTLALTFAVQIPRRDHNNVFSARANLHSLVEEDPLA